MMLDFGFYNMDCVEGMKEFPDGYFDLAIVDPPYGNAGGEFTGETRFGERFARYNHRTAESDGKIKHGCGHWHYSDVKWDIAPGETYFNELFRVSKNQIIWGGELFQTAADEVFHCMAETDHQRKFYYVNVRVRVDVVQ